MRYHHSNTVIRKDNQFGLPQRTFLRCSRRSESTTATYVRSLA